MITVFLIAGVCGFILGFVLALSFVATSNIEVEVAPCTHDWEVVSVIPATRDGKSGYSVVYKCKNCQTVKSEFTEQ